MGNVTVKLAGLKRSRDEARQFEQDVKRIECSLEDVLESQPYTAVDATLTAFANVLGRLLVCVDSKHKKGILKQFLQAVRTNASRTLIEISEDR